MVRELHIEEAPKELSWEEKVSFWEDLIFDEIPLPTAFQEMLLEEYQHLTSPPSRPPENEMAWAAYKSWVGDFVEDARTPRERLELYFEAQERMV